MLRVLFILCHLLLTTSMGVATCGGQERREIQIEMWTPPAWFPAPGDFGQVVESSWPHTLASAVRKSVLWIQLTGRVQCWPQCPTHHKPIINAHCYCRNPPVTDGDSEAQRSEVCHPQRVHLAHLGLMDMVLPLTPSAAFREDFPRVLGSA